MGNVDDVDADSASLSDDPDDEDDPGEQGGGRSPNTVNRHRMKSNLNREMMKRAVEEVKYEEDPPKTTK